MLKLIYMSLTAKYSILAQPDALVHTAHEQGIVGNLPKDKFKGKFVDEWNAYLKDSSTELDARDVAPVMAGILAKKDDEEIASVLVCLGGTRQLIHEIPHSG